MASLSQEHARQFLERHRVGRLGCFSPEVNRTYVVPLSYVFNNGVARFVSLEGQKVRYLREHPEGICLEVDDVDDEQNWTSVIATGRFEELVGARRREAEKAALSRVAGGPLRFALAEADIYRPPERAVLWTLHVEELTGRREKWDFAESFRYW